MNHPRPRPRRLRALPAALVLLTGLTGLAGLTACGLLPTGPTRPPLLPETPRVAEPRDLRGIPACQLLTPTQATGLGLDPATAKPDEFNSIYACDIHARDSSTSASLGSAYRFEVGGLDRLYRNRQLFLDGDGIFVPGTLDGFPTVITDANSADDCVLNVGVADDQVLVIDTGIDPYRSTLHACDLARDIASAVLTNLPPYQ
jgi:hypothetical protein